MIDIALNNGDLIANSYGDISLEFSDDDDIIQMLNSAINTIKGENIFHTEYGNDAWNKRLKIADSGFATIEACARDTMMDVAGDLISEITYINASRGEGRNECILSYEVLTEDDRTISSSTNINIL